MSTTVPFGDCPDWSNPVQIRIRDGRVEIRRTSLHPPTRDELKLALYVRDGDEPEYTIDAHDLTISVNQTRTEEP